MTPTSPAGAEAISSRLPPTTAPPTKKSAPSSSQTADLFGNDDLLSSAKVDHSDPLLRMARNTSPADDDIFATKPRAKSKTGTNNDLFSSTNDKGGGDIFGASKLPDSPPDLFASTKPKEDRTKKPVDIENNDDIFASVPKPQKQKPAIKTEDDEDLFGSSSITSTTKTKAGTKVDFNDDEDDIFGGGALTKPTANHVNTVNSSTTTKAKTKTKTVDLDDDIFADASINKKKGK